MQQTIYNEITSPRTSTFWQSTNIAPMNKNNSHCILFNLPKNFCTCKRHHHRWRTSKFCIWWAPMTFEQGGFFLLPHLSGWDLLIRLIQRTSIKQKAMIVENYPYENGQFVPWLWFYFIHVQKIHLYVNELPPYSTFEKL